MDKSLKKILTGAFFSASVLFFLWMLRKIFLDLRSVEFFSTRFLLAAILLQSVNVLGQFFIWNLLLRLQAARDSVSSVYRSYAFGALGRYLPAGKLGQLTGLLVTASPSFRSLSFVAFFEWTLSAVFSGFFLLAFTSHWFLISGVSAYCLTAFVGATALIFLPKWETVAIPVWITSRLKAPTDSTGILRFSRRRILIGSALMLLLSWIPEAFAIQFLYASSRAWPAFDDWMRLIFADAASYLGGMVAFVVPAGIGIREGLFYWISKKEVGDFSAGFVPIALRGAWVVGEAVFFLPLVLFYWRRKNEQR